MFMKWGLTLFGPFYFGYQSASHDYRVSDIWLPVGWAVFCALWFMWSNRSMLRQARTNADLSSPNPIPTAWAGFATMMLAIAMSLVFIGFHLVAYFAARWVSGW